MAKKLDKKIETYDDLTNEELISKIAELESHVNAYEKEIAEIQKKEKPFVTKAQSYYTALNERVSKLLNGGNKEYSLTFNDENGRTVHFTAENVSTTKSTFDVPALYKQAQKDSALKAVFDMLCKDGLMKVSAVKTATKAFESVGVSINDFVKTTTTTSRETHISYADEKDEKDEKEDEEN